MLKSRNSSSGPTTPDGAPQACLEMIQGHLKFVNLISLIVWSLGFRVQGLMHS